MKRAFSLILALVMLCGMMPSAALATEEAEEKPYEGKALSILGDSISSFKGVSNSTSYNSTIGSNAVYYSEGTLGVYRADTWWQQVIDALGMELLVNNSWSGSTVFYPRLGESSVGYGDRCVNLHNDSTGIEPDVIVVFLGTNDFSYYQSTLGTADIDYNALITIDGYATPTTTCEAYAIMLHKMTSRYPDAEIYCMGMTARRSPDKEDSFADVGQPTAFNAELKEVITYFGATYVGLENCGIDADAETFDTYMGDGRVHPNAAGMDKISEAFISTVLGADTDLYDISFDLTNVSEDGAHAVLPGESYAVTLTEAEGFRDMKVTVTMGDMDVTAQCYTDGAVSIPSVTGDVVITASTLTRDPLSFRWEFDGTDLVTVTTDGNTKNSLTALAGSASNGVFGNTRYQLEQPVVLLHDRAWVLEWKGAGAGGVILAKESTPATGDPFIFRRQGNQLFAIGIYAGGQFHNYGITLPEAIDTTLSHTYRLENRIASDGSNMIWLYVNDVEIGPLNNHFIGGAAQGNTSNWISGQNLLLNHIGTTTHPLTDMSVEYLQIAEDSSVHRHRYVAVITRPTYTESGYTTYTCSACDDCYISDYTAPIALYNYRWEVTDGTLVSISEDGNTTNTPTLLSGAVMGSSFDSAQYTLDSSVHLYHDAPWVMEWKANGDWSAMLLTSTNQSNTKDMTFLFRTYNQTGLLALGTFSGGSYHNYGIALADYGLDMSIAHTYRLENRIASDGSNMVYLAVDGTELGAMNNYYIGGTNSQNKAVNWVNGQDFSFGFLGSTTHPLKDMALEYLQVYEGGKPETPASPYLQQLPEDISGCSNLYNLLTPVKGYYTATKYDTSNGQVLSVVIPVEPGDRIAASSFGSKAENMGSVNGIRVTYLLGDKIVSSLSAGTVYDGYMKNGYITVPEGVDAVCIPWWAPSDRNWLTLGQISKDFATHSLKSVPAQAPTCTEKGYTAGEVCEYCGDSLGTREEISATGHNYEGDTCTVCGKVNVLANLDGKYVSILGDSISTFQGYSNDATVNSTIGGNGPRYAAGAADTKPGSYCLLESVDDTWWMDFANRSGMKLLVNNSWAGSQVFGGQTSDGRVIPAAYLERCVNLHDDTLDNNPGNAPIHPDVIFVYLGINDYNFNRSQVGTGAVDYAKLVNSDGAYVTPTTFGEAYGILLHKMKNAYPDAQIFAMTLLPENLYSVDRAAWEQHNAYIRAAAQHYGIPLVDLAENCAITWENYSGYMIDKIHPTTAGMQLISDCIEAELVSYYSHPVGDVNGDGVVTHNDAVYLLLHTLFGSESYPLSGTTADFDRSGAVGQEDAVYLLLHTLFGESFYPL